MSAREHKYQRVNRTPEEKKKLVRDAMTLLMNSKQTFGEVARQLGVHEGNLRVWLNEYGKAYGWTGSAKARPQSTPAAPRDKRKGAPPQPSASWLRKNGSQLRLSMGLSEQPEAVEVESTEYGDQDDDQKDEGNETLLSRPEPPRSELKGEAIVKAPASRPRREPLYTERFEAEPVRPEPEPTPASELSGKLLSDALRERDAVLTTFEILLREGRLKMPTR